MMAGSKRKVWEKAIHTYEIPSGVKVNGEAGANSEVGVNSKAEVKTNFKVSSDCR